MIILSYYQGGNQAEGMNKMNLILKVLIVIDALFLIVMYFVWIKSSDKVSHYWTCLYSFHLITYLLALAEIAVKVIILLKAKK